MTDAVEDELSSRGARPLSVEGRENALWVLMDYGDLIVHVFKREAREFYDLERLWGDAKRIPLGNSKDMALGKS